jgi:hypothetical protein
LIIYVDQKRPRAGPREMYGLTPKLRKRSKRSKTSRFSGPYISAKVAQTWHRGSINYVDEKYSWVPFPEATVQPLFRTKFPLFRARERAQKELAVLTIFPLASVRSNFAERFNSIFRSKVSTAKIM